MSKRKPRGKCEFCGSVGALTGEHIWAEWLQDVLPLTLKNSHHFHTTTREPNWFLPFGFGPTVSHRRRAGAPGSRKLPIACARCNNGWMSQLQQRAGPMVETLVKGNWVEPNFDVVLLAAWCTMTAMVFELADPETGSISPEERDYLRVQSAAPPSWNIWIGLCPSEKQNWRAAHRGLVSFEGAVMPKKANGQISSFAAGHMLFQVLTLPLFDSQYAKLYALETGLRLLHPVISPLVNVAPRCQISGSVVHHQERVFAFLNEHPLGKRTDAPP